MTAFARWSGNRKFIFAYDGTQLLIECAGCENGNGEDIGKEKTLGRGAASGRKNSALPLLAAAASVDGVSVIKNCPRLSDVDAAIKILRFIGCRVWREGGAVTVDATGICRCDVPRELMCEMRSSVIFVAPARPSRHGGDIRARRL